MAAKIVRLFERFKLIKNRLATSPALARMRPWLALVALWLLFELPMAVRTGGVRLGVIRPSADLLVLLTLAALSGRFPGTRIVRTVLLFYACVLVLIRLDYVIFMLLMRDEPLLYDQWLMVRHLFVLISDLWSPTVLLATLTIGGFLVLLPWIVRRLLRTASALLEPDRVEQTARVGYATWWMVLILSLVHGIGLTKKPIVVWVSPAFADNIVRSTHTYRAIQAGIKKPAYEELAQIKLPRDERPDVYLLLIESYGRLMFTEPGLKGEHAQRMATMQTRLEQTGWHSASAFSRSSVSGGRSWMAEGSILLGTQILHESVFQHLIANTKRLPHLVSFLDAQGYSTILLAGSDRERPGIKASNPYGYQHYVNYDVLGYHGPAYGWGIVPDQFSLGYVRERFLNEADGPVFFNFHMVTSHAPWHPVPEIVADWRTLNGVDGEREASKEGDKVVLGRLRNYQRDRAQRHWYMGELTAQLRDNYARAIDYELALVSNFLAQHERDALVIVMGDHQPPVIPKQGDKFDVPVHVFARRPELLAEFKEHGYVPGLTPTKLVSSHGGLMSLLTRALVRSATPGAPLPPFRSQGVVLLRE